MKTALEELIDELEEIKGYKYGGLVIRLIKNKLEKEKEQIKRAFEFGVGDAYNYNQEEGEEYYNQTYKEVTALENK